MGIQDFIERNAVFTTEEAMAACGATRTTSNLLSRAAASGKIERVRRGLYVSHVGEAINVEASQREISAKLWPGRVLSHQTALETWHAFHYPSQRLHTCWGDRTESVDFHGVRYVCMRRPAEGLDTLPDATPMMNRVTSPEQTIVDCCDRPRWALGIENVCRSLVFFRPDVARCLRLARARSEACARKVALAIWAAGLAERERDRRALAEEEARVGSSYAYFGVRRDTPGKLFVARWRVYVPGEFFDWIEE